MNAYWMAVTQGTVRGAEDAAGNKLPALNAAYILGREPDNTRKKMSLMYSLPYVIRAIGKMGKGTGELWGCDSI